MKKMILPIITVCIMLLINWGAKVKFGGGFFDYSLLVGIGVTAVVAFFNTKGDYFSQRSTMETHAITGIKVDDEKTGFNPNSVFYSAIGYTLVALAITIFIY